MREACECLHSRRVKCRSHPRRFGKPLTMSALSEVRCVPRRSMRQPANFDELEDWIDSDDPHAWFEADPPLIEPLSEPLPDLGVHVDLAVGEFFRGKWRQRLADAEGDFGHVARQMRKAGVPLDLALVILLMPDPVIEPQQVSIWPPERVGWPGRETTPGLPVPRTPVQAASLRLDASSGPTRQPGQAAHRQADVTEAAIA